MKAGLLLGPLAVCAILGCAGPLAAQTSSEAAPAESCWELSYQRQGGFAGVDQRVKGSCSGDFELINGRTDSCRRVEVTDPELGALHTLAETLLSSPLAGTGGKRSGPRPAPCPDCISQHLQIDRGDILVTCEFAPATAQARQCVQLARSLLEIYSRGQGGGANESGMEPATAGAACTTDR